MIRLWPVVPACLLLITACVSQEVRDTVKPIDDPGLACTLAPCECVSRQGGFFAREETAPIVWQGRDGASCPEGFRLRRIEPIKPR